MPTSTNIIISRIIALRLLFFAFSSLCPMACTFDVHYWHLVFHIVLSSWCFIDQKSTQKFSKVSHVKAKFQFAQCYMLWYKCISFSITYCENLVLCFVRKIYNIKILRKAWSKFSTIKCPQMICRATQRCVVLRWNTLVKIYCRITSDLHCLIPPFKRNRMCSDFCTSKMHFPWSYSLHSQPEKTTG